MRIPSGTVDQYIYFVGVDATDLKTRETGLSSFTVYRSRNGAAAAAYTTPTINETDSSNMPGVYELLLDEDMTIGSGNLSEEIVLHITHSGMAPVTRVIELYIPHEQSALRAQCGNAKRVWVASSTGSDTNDGLTPSTAKTLKGCIAVAERGDAIYALPETSSQRLDYYWNGSSNTQSDGFGNINLSAGVSFYGNGNTYHSFRALSTDNNSQTSRGIILITGPGSVIQDVTIWPRASEPGVVCAYTRSGTTVTVTHTGHGYATGMTVAISGSVPENIDGEYSITVTGENSYTLTTAGSSSTPGLGTFRFADYDIYQASFGNSSANDATFSPSVTLRRCKSLGTYASDVAYWDVSSSTLRQYITIEDCDFVSGWDCLYLSSSAQTANIKNTRLETYGRAPVDATYSRVVRQGNALVVYDNSHLVYAGGSTTKRAIDVGGGTVILQRGSTITRSGDTAGSDVYASSASTILIAGTWIDPARITNSGTTNYGVADAIRISGDGTAADNIEATFDGTGGTTIVAAAITVTTPVRSNAIQIEGVDATDQLAANAGSSTSVAVTVESTAITVQDN